jgi:AraC-like DNA-binding protein
MVSCDIIIFQNSCIILQFSIVLKNQMRRTNNMELITREQADRQAIRAQANRDELIERIAQTVTEDGTFQVLPGLYFNRSSIPTQPSYGVSNTALCVIAQGSKEVLLGDSRYRYDPVHYLLATIEMPIVSQVVEASQERPYLNLRLQLDPNLVSSVIVEAGHPVSRNPARVRALDVSPLDTDLLDAVVRLVRLLDWPNEARILMPLITREIVYRLLLGEQSERLCHLAVLGGQLHRISKVIERIRKDFDQPLRIDAMAQDIGMSVSGFHSHFKAVTAMSPLQFQKQLRLQEARRLMLSENLDAASAGYRVGYDDASHFSREYKSLFGNPPMRDAAHLREVISPFS